MSGRSAGERAPAGRLSGKHAVITAAAAGIGRAAALAFAREGAKVWATDIDLKGLASLEGMETARLDVTDAEAVEAFEPLAHADILFNCAGIVPHGTVLDGTLDDWWQAVDVNLYSMVRTIRVALPGMIARQHGVILNMASVASSIRGVPNRAIYGATKAAVIGLTKAIAADHVGQGIRANAICPGTVDTPSLQARLRATGDYDAARAAFTARQPMGRLGLPEEIAALATYLASDEAAFTTGATHVIDGGWTM